MDEARPVSHGAVEAVVKGPPASTVLVAEDDPDVREVVRRVLSHAGYGVVPAEHGRRALELLGSLPHAVDLVVADVRMPELDGLELGRILAETRPELPVIYISGWLEEQMPSTTGVPEGAAFVLKPFTSEQLVGTVREALARQPRRA